MCVREAHWPPKLSALTDSLSKNEMQMFRIISFLLLFLPSMAWAQFQSVTQAEYFWGTDPGQGMGTAMTAVDGNFNQAIETAMMQSSSFPAVGTHKFSVRMRDAANAWGPVFSTIIVIDNPTTSQREIKVTAAEYFWDTDPGQGSGTAMVAFDGNFNQAIEQANMQTAIGLSTGNHKLNIRVRDADNAWSPVFSVVVQIDEPTTALREIKVTAAEYFWDTDPGQGSGTAMIAFDGNFNQAIEQATMQTAIGLSVGNHILNYRMRDAENAWSPLFRVVVNINEPTTAQRQIFVAAAEYWFDADPGAGNGTPMLAVDGNFNSVIEAIKGGEIPSPVTAGIHVLWMRAKEPQGAWGPKFGIVVNMDITIDDLNAVISGPAAFCQGQSLIGANYAAQAVLGSSYAWSITNGVIISGQGTPNVIVNWNPSGNRTLTLNQCLDANCDTDVITIVVNPTYNVAESATICQGQSIFLGGALQTQAGQYTDVFETINGCDSTVVTTLSVVTQIVNNVTAAICQGQSIFLGGANQTQSGSYTDTYVSAAGCDSLVVTQLTVHPTYYIDNAVVTICPGESAFLGGDFQTVPGFYTDVFSTEFGCDSIVVTNLVAVNNPVPVINQNGILIQTGSYVSYQWLLNGEEIDGATAQQWEPLSNGTYIVHVIDANGCEGTSAPFQVITVSVNNLSEGGFLVFPNPTSGEVFVEWPVMMANPVVQVLDATGRIVEVRMSFVENRMMLNLSGYARGTYMIRIISDKNNFTARVVVM
jgi:hypothetical protein